MMIPQAKHFLLALLLAAVTSTAAAQPFNVPADYATISAALADTGTVVAGSTIIVGAGVVLEERFEVETANITLTTDAANPATLRYAGDDFFPVIEVFADGFTIENFNIERNDTSSTGAQAIAIRKSNVTVRNTNITGTGNDPAPPAITVDHGLPGEGYADDISGIEITGNTISGTFGWGILIRSASNNGTINGIVVENNTIESSLGIAVFNPSGGPQNAVSGLSFQGNTLPSAPTSQVYDDMNTIDFLQFIADNTVDGAFIISEQQDPIVPVGIARRIYGQLATAADAATDTQVIIEPLAGGGFNVYDSDGNLLSTVTPPASVGGFAEPLFPAAP